MTRTTDISRWTLLLNPLCHGFVLPCAVHSRVVPLCVARLGCDGLRRLARCFFKSGTSVSGDYLREKEFGQKARQRFKTVLNVLNRCQGF